MADDVEEADLPCRAVNLGGHSDALVRGALPEAGQVDNGNLEAAPHQLPR